HMGVFKGLASAANLDSNAETQVLDALLRKSPSELGVALEAAQVTSEAARWLTQLLALNGGAQVVDTARKAFAQAPMVVRDALAELSALLELLQQRRPDLDLHVDLAELRGYKYHTGVMFAAYTTRVGRAIARGGRYDNIGARFGKSRPATGFSTD